VFRQWTLPAQFSSGRMQLHAVVRQTRAARV
jgi:hypothetical protein